MKKLSIVTDSSLESEKLKINPVDGKIYYKDSTDNENIILIEGSLKYRPIHCSELSKRLTNRDWNKSETLFISNIENEANIDDPILRYRKYTTYKPTGEIDYIDTEDDDPDLSFPLCGELSDETKSLIDEAYIELFDSNMIAPEEVCFMGSSKNVMDTSICQESIDIIKGVDSYTNSLDLCELIEYSSYPGISCRVDLSIRYSKINSNDSDPKIYNYFTTFKAFEYDNDRNPIIENMIEIIKDSEELVRIEYFSGTLRLFPVSPRVSECIINDCTIIYGKFSRESRV